MTVYIVIGTSMPPYRMARMCVITSHNVFGVLLWTVCKTASIAN